MNFLIFIIAFVMAVDENSCTRVLHRPLCACTLFGAVLGNVSAGLAAGAALELAAVAFDAYRPGNYILASLAAALLAVNGSDAASSAAAAMGFLALGFLIKNAVSLLCTALLPYARNQAAKRNEKGMFTGVIVSVLLYGIVFGAGAMWLASLGNNTAASFSDILDKNGWVLSALHTAAVLVGALGIAVLYRNLGGSKMPGAFLGGFACAAVLSALGLNSAICIICAMAAFAIASMDYSLRITQNDKPAETKEIKKGGAQWW
ncbi:MAG: PTS sugar transporter subunit IIC [Solobacterium sp.]|nr:PTS sugar transporter subunit IIC [Solobacterium sp.]